MSLVLSCLLQFDQFVVSGREQGSGVAVAVAGDRSDFDAEDYGRRLKAVVGPACAVATRASSTAFTVRITPTRELTRPIPRPDFGTRITKPLLSTAIGTLTTSELQVMWFSPRSADSFQFSQPGKCRAHARHHAIRRASSLPQLENLEVRSLLSLLTVTSSADGGPGSLRNAVAKSANGDTIAFARKIHDITLTSGALQLSHNLDIEGPGSDH